MSRCTLYLLATVLILVSLVLIVVGLQGTPVLWVVGLAVVALAMGLSLAARWVPDSGATET